MPSKRAPGKCAAPTAPTTATTATTTPPKKAKVAKKPPSAPLRKSSRVPNLQQPPPDLSGLRTSKATKGLLKHLAAAEVAGVFLPPSVVEAGEFAA